MKNGHEKPLFYSGGRALRCSKGFETRDGKRVQRFFSLGTDPERAERIARALNVAWDNEKATDEGGRKVWSSASIEWAYAANGVEEQGGSNAPEPISMPTTPPAPEQVVPDKFLPAAKTYTLAEALEKYAKHFATIATISEAQREKVPVHIRSVIHHLKHLGIGSIPMAEVDNAVLERIRACITSRPLSRQNRKEGDAPRKISVVTVTNWMTLTSTAFDWFDRHGQTFGWEAPKRWRENFGLTAKQKEALLDESERDTDGPPITFTLSELTAIYKRATKLQRKYMLLGLTIGWTQKDISTFKPRQFVTVGDDYFIDRRRHKTGVPGYWWVCPELATILMESMAATPANKDGLAFLSENGLPLVHGQTDSIKLTWKLSIKQAQNAQVGKENAVAIRPLSFKHLRKTGSQWIRNLGGRFGGEAMAQLFLAQKLRTISSKHYNSAEAKIGFLGETTDYEILHELQRKMHKQLKSMFDAANEQPSSKTSLGANRPL